MFLRHTSLSVPVALASRTGVAVRSAGVLLCGVGVLLLAQDGKSTRDTIGEAGGFAGCPPFELSDGIVDFVALFLVNGVHSEIASEGEPRTDDGEDGGEHG